SLGCGHLSGSDPLPHGEGRSELAVAGSRSADPAVPLPARARPARAGPLRGRARRPHARRADRAAVSGGQDAVRASLRALPARRRSVKITNDGEAVRVEVHVTVEWGAAIPELAGGIQVRVREYLLQMADIEPAEVDVVVDEIGPRA